MRLRDWWNEGRRVIPERWIRKADHDLNWLGHALNAYGHHTRWVRPWFWRYVWRAPEHYAPNRPKGERFYRDWHDLEPWRVRRCRLRGHPNGYIYYNPAPEAMEPDYRCKDCLEEIY